MNVKTWSRSPICPLIIVKKSFTRQKTASLLPAPLSTIFKRQM